MIGYKLPAQLGNDIDKLESLINGYLKNEVDRIKLRAFRVPSGVYEQRKLETFMVRIRLAGGIITPAQLDKVASLSVKYGRDSIHLTTRQEVQIHDVALNDVVTVIRALKKVGLSSRGGGGNTVRNIMASPDAGIDPSEVFDVLPYNTALTSRFLTEDDSWNLPRKLKISFSGTKTDKGLATINDLGFIAAIKDGKKGFKVYMAGGLGRKPSAAKLILDFTPEKEVYNIAKAVKNLFYKHGNRKNRNTARLRFLYEKLGEEGFKKLFQKEYEAVKMEGHPPLNLELLPENVIDKDALGTYFTGIEGPVTLFTQWKDRYVKIQKQDGLFSVLLPVLKGDIPNEDALRIASFLKLSGENTIRITQQQNFLFINIPGESLGFFHKFYNFYLAGVEYCYGSSNIVACAGASTCKLGICIAKNSIKPIVKQLDKEGTDLSKTKGLRIQISGCPNSCGQHLIGDLGFFGGAFRNDKHLYPGYHITAGAVIADGETILGEKAGKISARDLPVFINDVLTNYAEASSQYKSFREYYLAGGKAFIAFLLDNKFNNIPSFEDDKNYYFDWGGEDLFSITKLGRGECSAGILDFIDRDLNTLKKLKEDLAGEPVEVEKQKILRGILLSACRMLLVTRGIEEGNPVTVYKSFIEHFINNGLISDTYLALLNDVVYTNPGQLPVREVLSLADEVVALFNNMDDNLNFNTLEKRDPGSPGTDSPFPEIKNEADDVNLFKDLRGVACPMNFVKTKMELSKIKTGQVLEIYLDDGEPVNNVPGSVKAEGHEILEQIQMENYWRVIIRKGV